MIHGKRNTARFCEASSEHKGDSPGLNSQHYKKCGDLWRKFYDILMERHNCTQSMTNLKVWTLGPEFYDVLLNSS